MHHHDLCLTIDEKPASAEVTVKVLPAVACEDPAPADEGRASETAALYQYRIPVKETCVDFCMIRT